MPTTKEEKLGFLKVWMELKPFQHEYLFAKSKQLSETRDPKIASAIRKQVARAVETKNEECVKIESEMSDMEEGDIALTKHRLVVAKNVKRWREHKNWTQGRLATEAKIHQSYVSRIENGTFCCTYKTVARLAKALSVPVSLIDPTFDVVGNRIASIRTRKGISVANLASMAGLSSIELLSIECSSDVDRSILVRIAEALEVDPRVLDFNFDAGA